MTTIDVHSAYDAGYQRGYKDGGGAVPVAMLVAAVSTSVVWGVLLYAWSLFN
jgi:hypothetical protein